MGFTHAGDKPYTGTYRNDPKFSDRYAWANSADPDQTAPRSSLIRVYTVCHSVCIVWTHYSMVEPHNSNFRVITTNSLSVRIFKKFTVLMLVRNLRLIESIMVLRPRQGNLRQVFWLLKSHARLCQAWDLNNLKMSLRFPCRGLNTIIDYFSHTFSFPFLQQEMR